MERDYQRYRLSKEISTLAVKMFSNEIFPILSEYVYLLTASTHCDKLGDIIYRYSFDLDFPTNKFLLDEIMKSGLSKKRHWVIKFIHRLNALIRKYYQQSMQQPAKVCMTIYAISYKQFYKKFRFKYYPTWIHVNRQDILRMLLRYESIRYFASTVCIPEKVWGVLTNDFNVWLEGFASPIDTQIMKFGQSARYFCSLFPDTDRVFGSIGNFFNARMNSGSIMAHPPRHLIDDTVARILQCCVEAAKTGQELRFFFFAERDYIQQLDVSEFLVYKYTMPAGTYYYNSCSDSGQKYKNIGTATLGFWVLEVNMFIESNKNTKINYEKIPLTMSVEKMNFKFENNINRYNILVKGESNEVFKKRGN